MSEAIKPTPGPWTVVGSKTKYVESRIRSGWVQEIASIGPTEADNGYGPQQEANARLIAEAGTVAHETGLTPRQLVERVKEMEEALRNLDDYVCNNLSSDYPTGVDVNGAEFKAARAALSKSLPNTVAEVK